MESESSPYQRGYETALRFIREYDGTYMTREEYCREEMALIEEYKADLANHVNPRPGFIESNTDYYNGMIDAFKLELNMQ